MKKQWIERLAVLGCVLLAVAILHSRTRAQSQAAPSAHQQAGILTLEGPAIHVLVTARLPRAELRKLVTDSRTARDHPDLAEYYRSKADRLEAEAARDEQLARAFGDTVPMNGESHFSVGRNAFHYHLQARECLSEARNARLLADLYAQAAQGEGCFRCHNLNGRGGKIGPDLATEGTRGRSNAWLIGHFKNPQAYSPSSVMPAFAGLTSRQLETLAAFLQYQKAR